MQDNLYFRSGCISLVGFMVLLAGCDMDMGPVTGVTAGAARRTGDFASRRINNVSLAEVEPIANRVFRSHFRVDPAASTATVWVARPAEASDMERTGSVGERLAVTPREHRRVAELRLTPDGTDVVVQCKVTIQRLTTTERAAFARERGDDRPTDTPIDRAGPSAAEKRQEWTDVRRDRTLEQQILNAIQEGLSTTQPAGE